jgi:hypothetical protein
MMLAAAVIGAIVFAYQVPIHIVNPTDIRWMMKADRGASLLAWLFERSEPWTLPFGILRTMMAPLVTISDGLLSPPAKLLFSWVAVPWQYEGFLLLVFYMLQGVFGYLVLRALAVNRTISLLGAAFFALSPTLLQRFEHVSLSAHWEILAAWWLYLRRPPPGSSLRFLLPWLLLICVAVPTHPYLAAMVGALAAATYVRAVFIDRLFPWWTAASHAVIAFGMTYGVFWLYGYFLLQNHGEAGFGRFSADVFSFFNSARSSAVLPRIPRMANSFDLFGPYESYYYLGLGMIVVVLLAVASAIAARVPRALPRPGDSGALTDGRWPPLWPGILAASCLFLYALGTPVHVLGHELLSIPLYDHISDFTAAFRGSGRFAWPLYYLVMALSLAELARQAPARRAAMTIGIALLIQVIDTAPLRAFVRRDYDHPWAQLHDTVWHGIGHHFRSLRLVPPIVANRIACRHYDQYSDYEIKFGVVAAQEHMAFNSGSPARVETLDPLCVPMLDSLERGQVDDRTVYVPSLPYREAMEWWDKGRVVCGTIDDANVCLARSASNAAEPMTQRLLMQEPLPPPTSLHIDLRTGDQGPVDSTSGFGSDSATGRVISGHRAEIFFGRPLTGPLTLIIDAKAVDTTLAVALQIGVGAQSRTVTVLGHATPDTMRVVADRDARSIRFITVRTDSTGRDATAGPAPPASTLRIRRVTVRFE